MREQMKSILHSLGDAVKKGWTQVRTGCGKGWKAFSEAVGSGWTAFRRTKFAIVVSGWVSKLWNSRLVSALRSKKAALVSKLPWKKQADSQRRTAEKKSPTQLVEESDISTEVIENELRRERFKHRYSGLLRSTVYALIVTAAAAALIATLLLPVLQIYGNSMTPTLHEGDIVVSVKTKKYDYGDICSFYYSNRILVKRVIGKPLDVVSMDEDGNVFVNGKLLDEPYIKEKALGECDIEFPYRVPEGSYFMIGDHRLTSIDSRSSTIGCISSDEIVGRIVFTVWPPKHMGISK